MTTNAQLLPAIFALVDSWADAPVAHIGKTFVPPDTGHWYELRVALNDFDPTISDQNNYRRGTIQIGVCVRPNTGVVTLLNKAQAVATEWPKGTSLLDSVVVTTTPKQMGIIEEDKQVSIPVYFEYSE